ncbi:hypothetical protein QJS04_geneDACA011498 [Acorus gramineus]|uniref:Uncharacterized protein n=1 Tax=Acorus gramineus TaxID=55184 RepID=A0AAV9A2S8_ACOGR|nr:hypothetical protein QJS04_geneDACA011498 [Acorus gramineus]
MEERNDGEVNGMDVLGEVLGKEHCGRVRGMGSGVTPSQYFGGGRGRADGFGGISSQ